jgi:hypothetical protein
MFERNDRGEMPFHNAVKCAIATLTDKIISSENDLVGVCFYGTVLYPASSLTLVSAPPPRAHSPDSSLAAIKTGEKEQSQRL